MRACGNAVDPRQSLVVVASSVLILGCSPAFPAVWLFEDVGVFLAFERCLGGLVLLEIVEIFQEQQPGSLLSVIEFARATRLFPKDVVDIFESLFKHSVFRKNPGNNLFQYGLDSRNSALGNLGNRILVGRLVMMRGGAERRVAL